MAYKSLKDFIDLLEKEGELVRITQAVSTDLEITEITDRFSKTNGGGKALLFENTGTWFPVITNMMGSQRRIGLALGVNNLDAIGKRITEFLTVLTKPKLNLFEKLKLLPQLQQVSSWMPVLSSKKGVCQELIHRDVDLSLLPVLTCWPADGGKFITLPMVITKDPNTGTRNVGMYRMQVLDKNTTGMHWHKHKTGARHYNEYKKAGKIMPVSVALGGDPALTFAATAPLPDNIDEFMFAGFLRNEKVRLVKCITNELEVPADADIIIEGYVDPAEALAWEGPFGDHTGFYSLADWYPKFHVTCITHRKDAVYPATIVGIPPMEDAWIAKATERIFLPLMKLSLLPEIIDLDMPFAGVAHNLVITKIDKTFSGQGNKVMNALWGAGQMMFNKILVVVDGETNIHDYAELGTVITKTVNPATDIYFGKGPLDVLDHAASNMGFGGKMFIDATHKCAEELSEQRPFNTFCNREKIKELSPKIVSINDSLPATGISLFIISVCKDEPLAVKTIATTILSSQQCSVKALLFVDETVDVNDLMSVIWIALNNMDAERDTFVDILHNCVVLDGTRKRTTLDTFQRDWPNMVVSNLATIALVDKKWDAYNIGEKINSPALNYLQFNESDGAVAEYKKDAGSN